MRLCTSDTIEILFATPANSKDIPNIYNETASYQGNLDGFLLLSNRQNFCCNRSLVAVVALCLLSYAHSEQLNIFQTIVGHVAFAHNIPKYAVKTFHQIGLAISYKSICCTFGANANAMKKEMREKIMTHHFFILYNNMNFYEHVHNTCIFNQGAQINYTAGYICFWVFMSNLKISILQIVYGRTNTYQRVLLIVPQSMLFVLTTFSFHLQIDNSEETVYNIQLAESWVIILQKQYTSKR